MKAGTGKDESKYFGRPYIYIYTPKFMISFVISTTVQA